MHLRTRNVNEIYGKAPLNNSAKWGRGGALAIGTMTSQSTPQPITGPLLARAPGLQPRLAQWLMRPWDEYRKILPSNIVWNNITPTDFAIGLPLKQIQEQKLTVLKNNCAVGWVWVFKKAIKIKLIVNEIFSTHRETHRHIWLYDHPFMSFIIQSNHHSSQ